MSDLPDQEARSWTEETGEGLVDEMKRAVERLREQFVAYREQTDDGLTPAD